MKSWNEKLQDLQSNGKPLKLYLEHPTQGGGYANGSKNGYRAQLKNAMASALLEEGCNLQWTSRSVEEVLQKMGTKSLSNLMASSHTTRFQCAKQALAECGIAMPENKPYKALSAPLQKKKNFAP